MEKQETGAMQKGFTLLELMFAIAIVGILAAFAIPAFQSTVQNNQLVACANKLVAAIQYAKSEAIGNRQTVLVAADAASAIQPAFRVGRDPDGNNQVEDGADLLQSFACDGGNAISMTPTPTITFLSFAPTGFRADGQGQIVFRTCSITGNGRDMTVTTGGGVSSVDTPDGGC